MGRFKLGKLTQEKKGWKGTIIERIGNGKVLPILSNVLCNNLVFGNHEDVIKGWADYIDYPFDSNLQLTSMTQYQRVMSKADPDIMADDDTIKEIYLNFLELALKSISDKGLLDELEGEQEILSFSEKAKRLQKTSFENGKSNPLLLLADLPLPIYLTTSYHTFLEMALEKAGRKPKTEICYWDKRLERIPSVFQEIPGYVPTKEEPLVYHLHGWDKYPSSLVLTEDDYLDFLVTIARDIEVVPLRVRQAIADSSLMLLGYSLPEWDFRVLFRGLIKTGNDQRRVKSVFIQLVENEREKNYWKNYLEQEADFEAVWRDTLAFMQELWQGMQDGDE